MQACGCRTSRTRAGVSVKTVSNVVNGYLHVRRETRDAGAGGDRRAELPAQPVRPQPAQGTRGRDRAGRARAGHAVLRRAHPRTSWRLPPSAAGRCWSTRPTASGSVSEVALGSARPPDRRPHPQPASALDGRRAGAVERGHAAGAARREDRRRPGRPRRRSTTSGAARLATDHLLGLGRRRVAAIGYQARADAASGVAPLRRRGYERALAAAGIAVDAELTPAGRGLPPRGRRAAMAALLALPSRPTRCSASTTCSPWAPCVRSPSAGCGFPRTSR